MKDTDGRLLLALLSELSRWPTSFQQTTALQARQIRRLVDHAEARVPFYRRIYREAGFEPAHFASLMDIGKIPLISREQRQDTDEEDLLASRVNVARLIRNRTSGSSGRPINIFRSKLESSVCDLVHWRMYQELGARMRDKRVSIALLKGDSNEKWYRRLGIFPMEKIDFLLPIGDIVARLRRIKPDILICSSSTAAWLATEMGVADRKAIRPRTVVTWGDTITSAMREQLRSVFHAKIVDFYGSHETRMIAIQCTETGLYHLYESMAFVEVLRDGQPVSEGEEGEVVVTALWSYVMPFIRYRQGDIAKLGPKRCPCGAPVRTLMEIQGRTLDLIPIPGRGLIHPYNLIRPVVASMPWIKRFQFVQRSPETLLLILVPTVPPTNEQLNHALYTLQSQLGEQMRIQLEVVKEIPPLPTGKYYPYLSLQRQQAWQSPGNV